MIKYLSGAAFLSACLSLVTTSPAQAATIIINSELVQVDTDTEFYTDVFVDQLPEKYAKCHILYKGSVEGGDLFKFYDISDFFYDSFSEEFPEGVTLCLNSPGGDMNAGLEIVTFFRESYAGLQTHVADGDLCASACSDIFLSGAAVFEGKSTEVYSARSLAPTAKLGVHAPRIELPSAGESYDAEKVASAYDDAMVDAARLFLISQQHDDEGTPYLTPYLFARSIETPPHEMYYVSTVADAIFSQIPVTGISYDVTLDEELIETICDNVFLYDDGAFSWSDAPTWKSNPLASIYDIWPDFLKIIEAEYHPETGELDPSFDATVTLEREEGAVYGYRRGYRTRGPEYAEDCLVRLPTDAPVGTEVNMGTIRTIWDLRTTPTIEVRIGLQTKRGTFLYHEPGYMSSPHAYWQHLSKSRNATKHTYPALMMFSFGMNISDLPRSPSLLETAKQSSKELIDQVTCEDLWYYRNRIMHEYGYCFSSERGIAAFGNEGCRTDSPELSYEDAEDVRILKILEAERGC
ncbi:YARHG domain-containing protein [Shimia sp. R9_1]|uniref:YARHG domain-containing protein n=1 Tax=Shimia sp. R9_1 TaxID=2821111 RepID=UPI001FFE2A56|nr:YARHG domain-containing protein [Shimia sp. R9_1]